MKKLILLFFAFFLMTNIAMANGISNKYDLHFKKYSKMYNPTKDWVLLKAQCYQESRFIETATSPVGAMGLCQFMPATFKEGEKALGVFGDPYSPQTSIMFAAWYMNRMYKTWNGPPFRTDKSHTQLALASYNAGAGHLLKAQKKCGDKKEYDEIIVCLPQITGIHSKETTTYVIRIYKFYDKMREEF